MCISIKVHPPVVNGVWFWNPLHGSVVFGRVRQLVNVL